MLIPFSITSCFLFSGSLAFSKPLTISLSLLALTFVWSCEFQLMHTYYQIFSSCNVIQLMIISKYKYDHWKDWSWDIRNTPYRNDHDQTLKYWKEAILNQYQKLGHFAGPISHFLQQMLGRVQWRHRYDENYVPKR